MIMQIPWERSKICVSKWKGPSAGEQGVWFLERSLLGTTVLEARWEQGNDQKQGRPLDAARKIKTWWSSFWYAPSSQQNTTYFSSYFYLPRLITNLFQPFFLPFNKKFSFWVSEWFDVKKKGKWTIRIEI